jgi:folate-binding protein YgfZ
MKTLAENRWMPAAFPNVQGRLIASVRVIRFADEVSTGKAVPQFLIDIEAANYNSILQALDRFTLAGDFRVTDLTDRLAMLSLQGTDVLRVARTVLPNLEMERYAAQQVAWLNGSVNVIRATHTAEDGLDLLVNVHDCEALWKAMLEAGFLTVGFDALETLRVEAGEPRYGVDMDETNVISETNLDEAISFTKGCYIGQEIIARIKYRGHVAKKLTGLMFAGAANISAGTRILSAEEKEIGRLTSVTFSPTLNRLIALGYLKYDYLSPGTKVEAVGEDYRLPAVVTEPPFIRGSWYTG